MDIWNSIGMTAAILGAISLIPEVIKAFKTHHLKDISWAMLILFIAGSILWGIYAIHAGDIPLLISAIFNFVFETMLIVMKIHYEKTGLPMLHFMKNNKNRKFNQQPAFQTEMVENE